MRSIVTSNAAAGALFAHHPKGVSTGVFESRCNWERLVAEAAETSTFAVELSALSEDELPGLIAYLAAAPRLPFRYVSVHAPVKNRKLNDAASAQALRELPLWVRSIVTHPDTLAELAPYRELDTRLVVENMDDRKTTGRTADELEPVFDELPQAGFCLDVAHVHSIDPTMAAGHELLDRFRSRLRQVHLSSLTGGHHVPLTEADEELFADVLDRCRDVPWILEARQPERWLVKLKPTKLWAVEGLPTAGRS
jgi:hypothetical protein